MTGVPSAVEQKLSKNTKRWCTALGLVAAFSFIIAGVAHWPSCASLLGSAVAQHDTARGRFKVYGYTPPTPWAPGYLELLKTRYGVEFRDVADLSDFELVYILDYNEKTLEVLERKFGRNIFLEALETARRSWEQRNTLAHKFLSTRPKAANVECFRALPAGISMYEVILACGSPDQDLESGSGRYKVFIYRLADSTTVTIGTGSLNNIDQASYLDAQGQQHSLLLQRRSVFPQSTWQITHFR